MNDLLEKHHKVGQVLSAAMSANHPCMIDWAEIGFELKRIEELQVENAGYKEQWDAFEKEITGLRESEEYLSDRLADAELRRLTLEQALGEQE